MEYTHLGRLGLSVSRLCLGTMNFGWDLPRTSEEDAFRIMDRALELGINLFDTANVYGWREAGGKGEGITADHRPLVRPGRWAARAGGACHEGSR
jgi:aryl-alcohol dehydrogenase-like predicted oxidoreductase